MVRFMDQAPAHAGRQQVAYAQPRCTPAMPQVEELGQQQASLYLSVAQDARMVAESSCMVAIGTSTGCAASGPARAAPARPCRMQKKYFMIPLDVKETTGLHVLCRT